MSLTWAMGQKNLSRKSSISNLQFMSLSLGFTLTGAPSPGMGLSRNQHLLTEVCPRSRGGRFRVLLQRSVDSVSVSIPQDPSLVLNAELDAKSC